MPRNNRTPAKPWTLSRAGLVSAVCFSLGIAGGWYVRGSQSPASPAESAAQSAPAQSPGLPAPAQLPSAAQLKQVADANAAPLLAQLQADPQNSDLLTRVGNYYYDAQQYPIAVQYYERALQVKPSDVNVRTDMGTAYWYMGDADRALSEFNRALQFVPDNPNTLFNLGVVKWKGKNDAAGAIADWEKLLAAHPDYEAKDKVEQMLAEAKSQQASGRR